MRYVVLVGVAALFLLNCGMSEEEFRANITKDVQELCTTDYCAGFSYIMANSHALDTVPKPRRIPDLVEMYAASVADTTANNGQYKKIADAIAKYPESRRDQAAVILIRSSAYTSAYGQYLALNMYQSLGDDAWDINLEDSFRAEFMGKFFMPQVFDMIYESAVPDSTELDPRKAFSPALLEQYNNWVVDWLSEG
ncbi:hypothetical protein JXM67_08785 [candidate division WOR-3 bacterium]|nr:hypothetical protein [candidate division WOR-3 bacterium]